MATITKVLIANRGEIAIRIARAAHALGIQTISIYAKEDELSLHTRHTDGRIQLNESTDPVACYLNIDNIIEIALDNGCDAIHPGYGFLSENAELAEACQAAGILFIGPSAETLRLFGNKVEAKKLAASINIPVIPGSSITHAQDALEFAEKQGFPVMVKAVAGGGGRGMRAAYSADELKDAFLRCQSEAEAAFGNGALLIEKLLEQPRHIEVQILADASGQVVHLFERDCSIQQRNQKVIEIAPAPNLEEPLRAKLLNQAVALTKASGYQNAGTVEFLITPETGEHFFIECNPRIQVEHTVTEQITGIELVEAQFLIAAGASLKDLNLTDLAAPRGFSIQTRIVIQSTGTITAYKEPSGPGIRVDSNGYTGYNPPAQFDPLLGKLICTAPSYDRALKKTRKALEEFHIQGISTNLPQLRTIIDNTTVLAGNARTTLLSDAAMNIKPATKASEPLQLLEQQSRALGIRLPSNALDSDAGTGLTPAEGQRPIECPMSGSIIEIAVSLGSHVKAGDTLLVISAMKMETTITAPCSGMITDMGDLSIGVGVTAGEVVLAMEPSSIDESIKLERHNSWIPVLEEVATLKALAEKRLVAGSLDPGVVRQRSRGKLTCRERIELLLDDGSFREVGSVAGFASYDDQGEINAFTPANHVGGWGEIEDRTSIVCADDFTSRGGHADGAIGAKSLHLDRLSMQLRVPSVRLLDGSSGGGSVAAMVPQQKTTGESDAKESSGAIKAGRPRVAGSGGSFLPGHLGSTPYTKQLNTVPVVNILLGSVVGIGAAKAVLGHFSVMVRDIAQLFVAGPPVVSHAMGYDITKEDLGGWHVHCTNGSVDNLAESEQEAVSMAKQFLSYLPGSVYETPPVINCNDPIDRKEEELLTIIPRGRTNTFDIRRAIRLLADTNSFFEIGRLWGADQVTGFIRMNGHPLGVIASDSRHKNGGALTADGCDKLKRHLDICDTFHIPLLNLIDNPGFAVGLENEMTGTIRKGGEWMVAFAQASMPIFSVLMRRSFGVAGNNYATPQSQPSVRIAWPAADVGGIPPEGGIEAAYKRQLAEAEDPAALRAELEARIESARGPIGPLNKFQIEEMVDPRQTRRLICEWIPNAYKVISHADQLGPRDIQFRP
ncbi:MAG: ATP-grasp domain-containing protein [Gammaproteobacteria bacterium]|jgi:acetyl/propionyl-CoA carboxylase alpha subunit/acetyl-CoA carboxylase carboxyltransferase component|nr:ATP-grasp domain-containing protein [Gammaproteobacteria bacterium]MBT5203653.1 ATP-grasp domain-containing protein [Gammaproteobacteria bacterium]MBT5601621.1 ATP-grasp domain-containing protein [Gammaproteobacteria bacterium]MBT6245660.1 ATP-grasp domain-containing protein [Gammaproteobacteria bacterium]